MGSGDRDYGYTLGLYEDKRYIGKIILFHNEQTKATLKCHADETFCLFYKSRKVVVEQKYDRNNAPNSSSKQITAQNTKSYKHHVESKNDRYWPVLPVFNQQNASKNNKTNNKRRNKKRGKRAK